TCFYEDPIPDFSNLCRAFALFGKEGTEQIHQRVVQQAQETALMAGKKLRTDTTAVETNIHHPTDSSLLADSLRVMIRYLQRIVEGCQESEIRIVNHARAAKHRVLEIGRASRVFTQAGQEQLKQSYKKAHRIDPRTKGLSTLKHCFGMRRVFYKGEIGFERHVGWCIIAHNLVAMSRASLKAAHARCRRGCSHV